MKSYANFLKSGEEVTKEVSSQKYATGSVVIPITIRLLALLENIDPQNDLVDIQSLEQNLIDALKRRFSNLGNTLQRAKA